MSFVCFSIKNLYIKNPSRADVDLIVWLFLWRLAKKVKLIQMMYTIDHVFLMSLFMFSLFFYILWGRHLCQLGQVIHNLTVYSNLPFSLLKYISRYLCLIYVSPMLIQHYNLIYILKWFDWCISLFMRIHRSTMFICSHTQYESKYIIHDCIRRSSS